jgi:hypothetical protein
MIPPPALTLRFLELPTMQIGLILRSYSSTNAQY